MKKLFHFVLILFILATVFVEASVQESFVDSNGAKLFCRVIGHGEPLIVIHGGPGLSQDYLLPYMDELAKNNLVVFYDQRGCGRSTGEINSDMINVKMFVSDIDAIRQAFHFDTVTILGHSWGGFLAMEYAISYPDHVKKLILSNTMPANSHDMSLLQKVWMERMQPYLPEIAALKESKEFKQNDPAAIVQYYKLEFAAFFYDIKKRDLLHLQMSQEAFSNGLKVQEIFNRDLFQKPFDLMAKLKLMAIPTLVIHGDADMIPESVAENIHENIPHSKYFLMKQCGHFPYVEDPKPYFAAIKEFLDK